MKNRSERFFIILLLMAILGKCVSFSSQSFIVESIPDLIVQMGHCAIVNSVAFSPDGKYVLTGSDDDMVKLWDIKSGIEMKIFSGHSGNVTSVAFSPDGRYVLSGSWDNTLKLWDMESCREIHKFEGHANSVNCVAFSPDGQRALSGSVDHTLKLWDLESGIEIYTLTGHSSHVTSVAFSPKGRRALSGSTDNTLKLWDIESGRELHTLSGHSRPVRSVAISPDGKHALSGSTDCTLKYWDLESGSEIRTLAGHSGYVTSVAFSPDGKRALSGSDDGTLRLWDLESAIEIYTLSGPSAIYSVAISPDGRRALSGSHDKTIRLWDLESGRAINSFSGKSNFIQSVALSHDGKHALSGSFDKTLKLWDLENARLIHVLSGHSDSIISVAFSIDGRLALSGSDDRTIKLWDLESGSEKRTFSGHFRGVSSVSISPDGRCALSGSYDKTCKFWDLESGKEIRTLTGHSDIVTSVAFSPDGKYAISGSGDWTIKLWDLGNGKDLKTLAGKIVGVHEKKDTPNLKIQAIGGHYRLVTAVAFSPDGKYVISGSLDNTLILWDLDTGKEIKTLEGHSWSVDCLSFSPEGRYAITGANDKKIKLWDLESGSAIKTFMGHSGYVRSVAFSSDGLHVLSGSNDGTVRIWNINDGTWTAFMVNDDGSQWLVFTHDGYWDGSRDCGDLVAMVRGMQVWNIDQFAVRNNRPDIILERLGSTDAARIAEYRALYDKRLRRLGLTEADLAHDYNVPTAKVLTQRQEGKFIDLELSFEDTKRNLYRYNIFINDVPLYGSHGSPLSGRQAEIKARVELTSGNNKIEITCMNDGGAESFRVPLYANYTGAEKGNLYYLAFGVSKYKNRFDGKSIDLGYAAKDAQDLAECFNLMEGQKFGKVHTRIFRDSEVTLENIKKAKEFLKNSSVDDTFVLFISGHGMYVDNTYCYLTHETDFIDISGTSADFDLVEDLLQGIPPRKKLFLMDTCESGEREQGQSQTALLTGARGLKARSLSAARGLRIESVPAKSFLLEENDRYIHNDLVRRSGAIVFSSARGTEYALESSELENGLFTEEIIIGLAGKADANQDGSVDIRELTSYVGKAVPELVQRFDSEASQHPTVDRDNIYLRFGFPVIK